MLNKEYKYISDIWAKSILIYNTSLIERGINFSLNINSKIYTSNIQLQLISCCYKG